MARNDELVEIILVEKLGIKVGYFIYLEQK
jgi:hypothetical protein